MTTTVKAVDTDDVFDLHNPDGVFVGNVAMGDEWAWLTLKADIVPVGDSASLDQLLRDAGFQLRHDDRDRVHNLVDSYGEDEED